MTQYLAWLLLTSVLFLIGLIVTAALVIRDHRMLRRHRQRIAGVAETYRVRRGGDGADGNRLTLRAERDPLAVWFVRRLNYNPDHAAGYPLRPIAVVLPVLLLAAAVARGATNFAGLAGWAALPFAALLICRWFYGWCEDRLITKLYNQFPDALAMIVRAVRVGLPVIEAIRVAARENPQPTAREFESLVARTAIGVPLDEALREMAERNRLPEYRFFATALSLQSQTGGGLTETLEGLADTIRKRVAAKLRGHALAAEARMSSYILGALPLVTGALLTVMNPSYMQVLVTDPTGQKLLLIGAGLLGMGALSMRMLIRASLT